MNQLTQPFSSFPNGKMVIFSLQSIAEKVCAFCKTISLNSYILTFERKKDCADMQSELFEEDSDNQRDHTFENERMEDNAGSEHSVIAALRCCMTLLRDFFGYLVIILVLFPTVVIACLGAIQIGILYLLIMGALYLWSCAWRCIENTFGPILDVFVKVMKAGIRLLTGVSYD